MDGKGNLKAIEFFFYIFPSFFSVFLPFIFRFLFSVKFIFISKLYKKGRFQKNSYSEIKTKILKNGHMAHEGN